VLDTATATGYVTATLPSPYVVPPNTWFFLAGVGQVAVPTVTVCSNTAGFGHLGGSYASASRGVCYSVTGVTGALPASINSGLTVATIDAGVEYRRSA
jgi:Trk-type K+ transport system membrane component